MVTPEHKSLEWYVCLSIWEKAKSKPGDILGALAGEHGMPGKLIGTIDMFDKYTFVEVPREYAKDVLHAMQKCKNQRKIDCHRTGEPKINELDWLKTQKLVFLNIPE